MLKLFPLPDGLLKRFVIFDSDLSRFSSSDTIAPCADHIAMIHSLLDVFEFVSADPQYLIHAVKLFQVVQSHFFDSTKAAFYDSIPQQYPLLRFVEHDGPEPSALGSGLHAYQRLYHILSFTQENNTSIRDVVDQIKVTIQHMAIAHSPKSQFLPSAVPSLVKGFGGFHNNWKSLFSHNHNDFTRSFVSRFNPYSTLLVADSHFDQLIEFGFPERLFTPSVLVSRIFDGKMEETALSLQSDIDF